MIDDDLNAVEERLLALEYKVFKRQYEKFIDDSRIRASKNRALAQMLSTIRKPADGAGSRRR